MQSDKDETFDSWLVKAIGHVQGVGYSDACMRYARAQGITGWVRNHVDGSVELMLQGPKGQLGDMCIWFHRHGIPVAHVEKLEVSEMSPPSPRFNRFDRLPAL